MPNKPNKISELLFVIEQELKRLSPSLSISFQNSDPFKQILYIIKVSIDTILEERSALRLEYSTFNQDKLTRSRSIDVQQSQTSSRLLNAQKELNKFETLMSKKEQKLKQREEELEVYLKKLQDQEISLKVQESKLYEQRIELEKYLEEIASEKNNRSKLKASNDLPNHNHNIRKINLSLTNRIPANNDAKQNDMSYNKELESIRNQQLNLINKESELRGQENTLFRAKLELDKKIQQAENNLIHSSHNRGTPVTGLDRSFSFENESNAINPKYMLDKVISHLNEKDLQGPLMQLKNMIELLIREVEKKEKILERKSLMFSQKEEMFKQRLENFFKVEQDILRIKTEFLSFKTASMNEYDFLLSRIKLQSNSLAKNISDTEALRKKMSQSIFLNASLS